MTGIIRQLLDFSRRGGAVLETVDLRHIVSRTLEMLAPLADRSSVRVTLENPDEGILIRADSNQISQALTNIVVNGLQAMARGGELHVAVSTRVAEAPSDLGGDAVTVAMVEVSDQGPGISANDLPHIFEPFFTTKSVGEGSGLGLAVAYGIVREHNGWIKVTSQPNQGTRFSIFLRRPPAAPATIEPWTSRAVAS
jgi:two-component system, NtrC family, sensor kinase